jgi:hypothetical protein
MVRYEKGSDDKSVATTILAPVATSHPKLNEKQLGELRSAEAEYDFHCKKAYVLDEIAIRNDLINKLKARIAETESPFKSA